MAGFIYDIPKRPVVEKHLRDGMLQLFTLQRFRALTLDRFCELVLELGGKTSALIRPDACASSDFHISEIAQCLA